MKKMEIKKALEEIFSGINKFKTNYEHLNKKFTIDGRLVGDIGEVLAEKYYKIVLFKKLQPDYYLGLKIKKDGDFEETYNGPGKYIFEAFKHRKGINKISLRFPIKKLKEISKQILSSEKIERKI